jgi:hypothetical protein
MQAVHVPYNQFSMAITDMVSGRLDFMFLTSAAAIPQIAEGKLRALAASAQAPGGAARGADHGRADSRRSWCAVLK